MASGSREATLVEEELRIDGRKRKFKPLQAVRKLFSKGRRKPRNETPPVSVVAIKAMSTTALHKDDDDGGFKKKPSQLQPLGGTRSISEDSVFSPEQREISNLQVLKQRAVSEESIPRSALQAELYTRLNERRLQYSDEDDGLAYSPTPTPVTTADIIMCGSLKALPAAGKSTSQESDKSLISTDGSEAEDDPFKNTWRPSVEAKLSWPDKSTESGVPIDFDKLGSTELLKSKHAKDKINVKPRKGKTTRQSRKKQEGVLSHSLPSLNEEAPGKIYSPEEGHGSTPDLTTDADGVLQGKTFQTPPVSREKETGKLQKDETGSFLPQKTQVSSPKPASSTPSVFFPRSHLSSVMMWMPSEEDQPEYTSLRFSLSGSTAAGPSQTTEKNDSELEEKHDWRNLSWKRKEDKESLKVPDTAVSGGGISPKLPLLSTGDFSVTKTNLPIVPSVSLSSTKSKWKSSEEFASLGQESDALSILKVSSSSEQPARSCSLISKVYDEELVSDKNVLMSSFVTCASPINQVAVENTKEGLQPTDYPVVSLPSKEDCRLKRQLRSKTHPHPVSKDEQFSSKVQRAESHRKEATLASQTVSLKASSRQQLLKTGSGKTQQSSLTEKETKSVSTGLPEWIALAKKREVQMEEKREEQISNVDVQDAVSGNEKEPEVSSIASRVEKTTEAFQVFSRGNLKTSSAPSTTMSSSYGIGVKVTSCNSEAVIITSAIPSSTFTRRSIFTSSQHPITVVKAEEKIVKKREDKQKTEELVISEDSPKCKTQTGRSLSSTTVMPSPWSSLVASRSSTGRPFQSSTSSFMSAVESDSTNRARAAVKPVTPMKSCTLTKSITVEPGAKEEKTEIKADLQAWHANLGQHKNDIELMPDIKIELIEISSNTGGEGVSQKEKETSKHEASGTVSAASKEHQMDPASTRASKVLDIVKNFQNLQIS